MTHTEKVALAMAWYDSGKENRAEFQTLIESLLAPTEQEPVAWPCLIDSADFSENTITLVMQCEDYKVTAGRHWLSTNSPKENI